MLLASIPSPDFQYLQLGPIRIYAYALCIITGIVIASVVTAHRIGKRGGEKGAIIDFAVWAVVLGILFARLYHVLTHWNDYFGPGRHVWDIFAVWQGGIAIFGALIGGALGVFIASRLTGIRFLALADALAPGLLLAQAFGRLGNYFNHELFGAPTTLPWGLEIESSNPAYPIGLPDGTLFHPTFLYEIVWNLVGVVVLLAIERRLRLQWGKLFGVYLIWYGLGRFWIEGLRLDPSFIFLGLRTNQLAALVAIIIGVVLIAVQSARHTGRETSVYRPGRSHPDAERLSATEHSDAYYRVGADRRLMPVAAPIDVTPDGEAESDVTRSSSTDAPRNVSDR